MSDDVQPSTTDGNPFSLLAYVLFKVRHSLEDIEQAGRPPRWVRIGRGAEFKDDTLGSIVGQAVNGMAESLSFMAELTLDLEELLYQTDAAKAMAEVMLRLIQAATDENFQNGIETLVGATTLGELGNAMSQINGAATEVEKYLDYIPEPEDVRGLGHELYRMLCIVQHDFPRKPSDNSIDSTDPGLLGKDHVNMDESGKVRLCAWAYAHGVTAKGLGQDEANEKELFHFGMRRLFKSATNNELPRFAGMTWTRGEDTAEIYDVDFDPADNDKKAKDIQELIDLLIQHGYNTPAMDANGDKISDQVRHNLMSFQTINELPVTGEIDNATINRLMNLDFARKNLRRAKPFDPAIAPPWVGPNPPPQPPPPPPKPIAGTLQLINPGAEHYVAEALSLQMRTPHPYYVVPLSPAGILPPNLNNWPRKQGWLADPSTGTRGFVALRSRARNLVDGQPGRFVGGKWSEGEAASGGAYFFAARHVEPWRDGRTGTPAEPIFEGQPSPGAVTRMYQWVPLPDWLDPADDTKKPDGTPGWELYIFATALQRSLFTDRGNSGFPDRGLIRIETYAADGFSSTVTVREAAKAKASATTELFPDHGTTTAALTIDEVDRKRQWYLRRTPNIKVTADIKAVCFVVEGVHQSAWDTDAYFDDFHLGYFWKKTA